MEIYSFLKKKFLKELEISSTKSVYIAVKHNKALSIIVRQGYPVLHLLLIGTLIIKILTSAIRKNGEIILDAKIRKKQICIIFRWNVYINT